MNEQTKTSMLFVPLTIDSGYEIGWIHHCWSFIVGVFMSIIGYLFPIRDIVHLLALFFILDVIFGYWAAKKLRKEPFSAKIIWKTTMPRMVISLVLITGAFMWDSVYNQEFVATYKIIGWFISGVLLASIVQNGYHITNWNLFAFLGDFLKNKIKDTTGINTDKMEAENQNNIHDENG